MAKNQNWKDDCWVLLIQLYQKKPAGLKPLYCKAMVDLSLELHVPPQTLHQKMKKLENLDTLGSGIFRHNGVFVIQDGELTPRIQQLWQHYANNPQRLNRAVKLLRRMAGFGNSGEFYEGVELQESFEHDFRPIEGDSQLMPVTLIIILDLYFRLTPITMVPETPEIQDLARLMHMSAAKIADIMEVYQHCDPYLNRNEMLFSPIFPACQDIWQRYGNSDTEQLATLAEQLKAYYR